MNAAASVKRELRSGCNEYHLCLLSLQSSYYSSALLKKTIPGASKMAKQLKALAS